MPSIGIIVDALRQLNDEADQQQLRDMNNRLITKLSKVVERRNFLESCIVDVGEGAIKAKQTAAEIGRDFNIPGLEEETISAFDVVEILAGLIRGMAGIMRMEGIEWGARVDDTRQGQYPPTQAVGQS